MSNEIRNINTESTADFLGNRWAFILASFVVALCCIKPIYKIFSIRQKYTDFIVGSLAWSLDNKYPDYAVLFAIVCIFLSFFIFLLLTTRRLNKIMLHGQEKNINNILALLCTPAGIWFAGLLTTKDTSLVYLHLSSLLLILTALLLRQLN